MTAKTDYIRRNKQYIYRQIWVKRRKLDNTFEDDWQRLDFVNGRDQSITFGEVTTSVDANPGEIANFDINNYTVTINNNNGQCNIETDENSFWYGYLTRKYSKIKIVCGYVVDSNVAYWDSDRWDDGTVWGDDSEVIVFEGLITKITINENQTAVIQCAEYNQIFQKYDFLDLGLSTNMTVSAIYTAITNQSKITMYIPYVTPAPGNDVTLNTSLITGTYHEVLSTIAFLSNSVVYMSGNVINFKSKTFGTTSVYDFLGAGIVGATDIYNVIAYDDEGADRVRLRWQSTGEARSASSVDATLILKYLQEPQNIDLSWVVSSADKNSILASLLSTWEQPRPTITFATRFTLDVVNPLDMITLDIRGQTIPISGVAVWGSDRWDDGTVWGAEQGAIKISSSHTWGVLSITKDIDSWKCIITAQLLS